MLIREYAEGRERKTPSLEGHPIKMHDTSELGIHKWDVNKYRNLLHEILKSAQTMKGMKGFELVETVKNLGVIIDNDLSFNSHMKAVTKLSFLM